MNKRNVDFRANPQVSLERWKIAAQGRQERLKKSLEREGTDQQKVGQQDWLVRMQQSLDARKAWFEARLENVNNLREIVAAAITQGGGEAKQASRAKRAGEIQRRRSSRKRS